jgi:hypothetical protein
MTLPKGGGGHRLNQSAASPPAHKCGHQAMVLVSDASPCSARMSERSTAVSQEGRGFQLAMSRSWLVWLEQLPPCA